MTQTTDHWVYTGSSVSGNGYGYSIFRNDAALGIRHALRLTLGGHHMLVSVASFRAAHDAGQAFCHACHQWQVVQNRECALAQGFAVLG